MSPKLFMCESLWWVTFSCIVYTIEKIHKLYSVMCESAWIHLTVSTTTDSRWHIVHARFSMHMIREAIAFFSESTLLGGQRQRWSKKWNRFWISFWRWSAELQQLTAADCWVMNPCSLVGALCFFLARSSLEFWQTTKSTWLWSKVWISSEVKYIWKNAISRGWDISTLSWVQNNKYWLLDYGKHKTGHDF